MVQAIWPMVIETTSPAAERSAGRRLVSPGRAFRVYELRCVALICDRVAVARALW